MIREAEILLEILLISIEFHVILVEESGKNKWKYCFKYIWGIVIVL